MSVCTYMVDEFHNVQEGIITAKLHNSSLSEASDFLC